MAWWSWSMRRRLTLAICSTLALGVLAFGIAAWASVRHAAVEAAETRVSIVVRRTAEILAGSVTSQKTQARTLSRDPNVRALAAGVSGETRDSAVARVHRADSVSESIVAIEIWGDSGSVIHSSRPGLERVGLSTRLDLLRTADRDSAVITPLMAIADSVVFAALARIAVDGPDTTWAVVWRRLSDSTSRRTLTGLIGSDAILTLGNTAGDVWTNLNRRIPPPPFGNTDSLYVGTREEGLKVLGDRVEIPGAPWTVAIEFPYHEVVSTSAGIVRALALAAIAVLVLGAIIASLVGRSLARPLAELAAATHDLRQGDYSRRVQSTRRDEVGSLAAAFNTMASAIEDARARLESHAHDLERRSAALADQSRQTEEANRQLRTAVDAAEQARASLEIAVRENARTVAELDAVLTSAPVGFAFHDRDLRFVRVNERMASFFAREASGIIGRRPSELIPGIGTEMEEGLARALKDDKPLLDVELSAPGARAGEPPRDWLATMFPVRTRNWELVGVGSVLMDMSDYKDLERQFLQAQRMDAVGRLAGGIAHDFNNILTAVASFTEFAIRAIPKDHPAMDDLEQVRQAIIRAAGLIRQLLAFSRQQVMQPVVLNLSDVVRNLVPMLRRLIPESVALHSFLDPEIWPVRADPVQIEQILVNLVVNARDAMPDGGTLTITTSQASFDEGYVMDGHRDAAVGDYAVLAVSDSGVGMDAATKARVFEPFFTTKAPGKGTGLGLSTVYGIVKQSGGNIWLYSERGHGTTVKIFLPRHDGVDQQRDADGLAAAGDTRPALILLVEDDDLVRAAALRALSRHGHRVLEAVDGEAALSVIAREPESIDLVITDLVMPRLGGRELANRLRNSGHDAAILFISGYTGDAVTQRAMLEEGADFLEKPFTPDALVQKVDEILRHSRPATLRR